MKRTLCLLAVLALAGCAPKPAPPPPRQTTAAEAEAQMRQRYPFVGCWSYQSGPSMAEYCFLPDGTFSESSASVSVPTVYYLDPDTGRLTAALDPQIHSGNQSREAWDANSAGITFSQHPGRSWGWRISPDGNTLTVEESDDPNSAEEAARPRTITMVLRREH